MTDQENRVPATYCLSYDGTTIYGMSRAQLQGLHDTIKAFIDREARPAAFPTETYGTFPVEMTKSICRYAHDSTFFVEYGLDSFEASLQCVGAEQLRRIATRILAFLERFEEGEAVEEAEPRRAEAFYIGESSTGSGMQAAPLVTKYVTQRDMERAEVSYFVSANESKSIILSFPELNALCRRLGEFLEN